MAVTNQSLSVFQTNSRKKDINTNSDFLRRIFCARRLKFVIFNITFIELVLNNFIDAVNRLCELVFWTARNLAAVAISVKRVLWTWRVARRSPLRRRRPRRVRLRCTRRQRAIK